MRQPDTHPIGLIFVGTVMGLIHGVVVLLTTDPYTKTRSFLTTGNPYTAMYISLAWIDAIGIITIISAIWWYPWIERKIMERMTQVV